MTSTSSAPPLSRPIAALTIAGSDSGGGAGVQADLRTFAAHGLLGCTAITAITAQNTVGVQRADALDPSLVVAQIDSVLADLPVRAAKTGMLANVAIVQAVVAALARHPRLPVVVDPVCVSKHGHPLLTDDALVALRSELLPRATVITPNLPEAAALLGVAAIDDPAEAADALAALVTGAGPPPTVVLKGGHRENTPVSCDLVRLPDGRRVWLDAARITTRCDHGTGCTLSAAIAAHLALGHPIEEAIRRSKRYLTGALRHARPVGKGHSPVDHLWQLQRADDE